jgi:hypothetical protein
MKEARNNYHMRGSSRGGGGTATERDLVLQWGNRKRLRCVKVQRHDEAAATVAAEKAAISQRRSRSCPAPPNRPHPPATSCSQVCAFL